MQGAFKATETRAMVNLRKSTDRMYIPIFTAGLTVHMVQAIYAQYSEILCGFRKDMWIDMEQQRVILRDMFVQHIIALRHLLNTPLRAR